MNKLFMVLPNGSALSCGKLQLYCITLRVMHSSGQAELECLVMPQTV
jgi:hypothetical protein